MYTCIIGKRKTKIYFKDTGKSPDSAMQKKLIPKIDKASRVFTDFIFGPSSSLPRKNFRGVSQIDLSLTLCGKDMIRSFNRTWRKKDKVTDVLSFPVHESLRRPPNDKDRKVLVGMIDLGDVYICKEVARRQARDFEISVEEEIIHQFVHGFLHLLGFDHEISKKEQQIMKVYETNLLEKILS